MVAKNLRRAISAGVAVVILIVIIAAAGVGAYVVLSPGNSATTNSPPTTSSSTSTFTTSSITTSVTSSSSPPSSTSSFTTTTTTSQFVTTSYTSSTTQSAAGSTSTQSCTTTSTTSQSTNTTPISFVPNLLGNFSQMAIQEEEWINGTFSTNVNASYLLVGRPQVNGTQGYEVNITDDVISSQMKTNESGTLWFMANGTASELVVGSSQFSGAFAASEGELLMVPFATVFEIGSVFNDTSMAQLPPSAYTIVNETTLSLGSAQANQTVYSLSPDYIANQTAAESACNPSPSGFSFTKFVVGISTVPGINFKIFTLSYTDFSLNATSYAVLLRVTSLNKTS